MEKSGINKIIAAALATGIGAPVANAATTLTENISLSQLLSAPGSTYSGSFSIASLLAQDGLTGAQVTSATVTAYGMSDATFNQSAASTSSSVLGSYAGERVIGYSCGWLCFYSYPVYGYALYQTVLNTTTITKTDTLQDSISLQTGSATGTGAVSYQQPIETLGSEVFLGYSGNGTYGYNTNYSETNTITQGYYGALEAQSNLGAADLFHLSSTDTLSFTITDVVGAEKLTGLTLDLCVSAVPEPATTLLLTSGLGVLALAARRRRTAPTV